MPRDCTPSQPSPIAATWHAQGFVGAAQLVAGGDSYVMRFAAQQLRSSMSHPSDDDSYMRDFSSVDPKPLTVNVGASGFLKMFALFVDFTPVSFQCGTLNLEPTTGGAHPPHEPRRIRRRVSGGKEAQHRGDWELPPWCRHAGP